MITTSFQNDDPRSGDSCLLVYVRRPARTSQSQKQTLDSAWLIQVTSITDQSCGDYQDG